MRQIIAIGGGGFLVKDGDPLLDQYVLKQSKKDIPNICFLPTASGDSENYLSKFYNFFQNQKCNPSHLSLFNPPTRDLEDYILTKDIIYVGGGNTKNLLALWKDWELDKILEKAWNQGVVLAGVSAGSICWFEEGVTDSFGGKLEPLMCLGLLKGSNCPHYDSELERRPTYQNLISLGKVQAGVAADDGVAIHFIEQEISKTVSSRPNAKGYRVYMDEKIIEDELTTDFLGFY